MPRQNHLCCQRSMKESSSCIRNSYGEPRSRSRSVLLFGLLLLTFVSDFTNSTFTAPAGCSSVTWILNGVEVQNITCSGESHSEVPKDGKEGDDVLKLNLSSNKLTSLAIDEFQYFVNLIDLDLSKNQIPNITVETFSNLTSLQYLKLSANPISTLPSGIFTECSLITLDLSYLNLAELDKDFFMDLTSLLEVDLSHNNISALEKHLFKDSSLHKINLSWNNLIVLDNNDMFKKSDMTTLDLSNNVISTIDKNFLSDATSMTNLDLSLNQLTTLHKDLFKNLATLETLDVSNNMLNTVPNTIFKDTTVLNALDFSHNQLTSLDEDLFQDNSYLDTLYLNNNFLGSLPAGIFVRTVVLRTLFLNNNMLTSIDNDMFTACVNLEYVDLSGNDFSTISTVLFMLQTSTVKIDFSSNPFTCECTIRDYFYSLQFDLSRRIVNEDITFCDDSSSGQHIYLDYDADTCSGNLGADCTMTTQCMVRYAKCENLICVCADNFYDKNGNTTAGGQCENKIQLDYSCPYMDVACAGDNVECVAKNPSSSDTYCLCKELYYDNNPLHPAGTCNLKVELGDQCIYINNMCRPDNSECDSASGTCGCLSTYYSSYGPSSSGGECFLKKSLYSACNETYQCGTSNSECSGNICVCSDSFYDFTSNGECQGPSSFFSCYPDNASDTEVLFVVAEVVADLTNCEEYCFTQDHRYYHMEGSVCICGDLGTTIDGCCRYASSPCQTKTYLGPTTALALAGINITHIPQLTVGSFHEFSVTTNLGVIDEIRWKFGDSQSEIKVSGKSDAHNHTYTYSSLFWLTVSACVQVVNVCEDAALPLVVHVPPENLTTYITGLDKADVSSNLAPQFYATFSMGYNFQYYWFKDYLGDITKKQGCTDGWTAHRYSCIKLMPTPADFSSAKAACAADGKVLQIDFMVELLEIVAALSVSSEDLLLGAQRVGGVWQWSDGGLKTVFSDADLTDTNNGDCVVLVGTSGTLTSASCTTSTKYACMSEPVSCPKGGELMSNGHCYVLASTVGGAPKTWLDANDYCSTMFGGWLSNITDAATQTMVTHLLVNGDVSEAFIGLSDWRLEGYYMWADDTSFNFNNADYMPSVTSNDEDCFVTTNSSTWNSQSCSLYKDFVCQYSENIERVTVPSFLLGVADLGIDGQNLQQLVATDSFPSTTASSTTIMLFPDLVFSKKGNIRSWIFRSIDVLSGSYDISFQVYRPTCQTGYLYQAGCASTKFSTCSANTYTCTASAGCTDLEYFCYLSSTCKFINESCTCNTVPGCGTAGTMPDYKIVDQTSISVTLTGENIFTVPADISFNALDIIGIQFPTDQEVIHCENFASGSDQQTAYNATVSDWLVKLETFPASSTTEDITCYVHVIYTQDSIQYLPPNIGYSSSVGDYDIAIRIVDTDSKTLSLQLEESADNIFQLYPPLCIASLSASSLGTVCTEMNQGYDFTIVVGRGTKLESTWSFDISRTVLFTDSCVPAVASAVGDSCNASLVWSNNPYATYRYNTLYVGNITLNVTISNALGSEMRTLIILTEKSISGVTFSLVTPSLDSNTVAINRQSEFITTVANGTGLEYSFAVGGSPASSTNSTLIYSFTTTGTFIVQATVANILGTEQESIDVFAKQAAVFQNCKFLNMPYIAAVGIPFNVTLQCDANVGSEISVKWILSDGVSISSATSSISLSPNSWTEPFTFTSVSNVSVAAYVRDPFEQVSVNVTVSIFNAVASGSLTTDSSAVFSNVTIQFTATVPPAPDSYGIIVYSFDFGDGSLESSNSGIVTHAYNTSGNYTISVVASNGPSDVSMTSYVTVYELVTGLSLIYDGPKEKTSAVSFTASVTTGNFLSFQFVSSSYAVNETVTTNIYTITFATAGEYDMTVTVSNELSEETATVTAYIMEATDLILTAFRIDGNPVTSCIETTIPKLYSVEIIHYDATNVLIDWDFDGITYSDITTSKSHAYSAAGNYTVTVTAKYSPQSVQKSVTELICVHERITTPVIMIVSPIALPPNDTVTRVVTVSVATGDPLNHVWSTNATAIGSAMDTTFSVQFSTEGTFYVTVILSNEINYETVTEIVVVQEDISSMKILCTSCIEKNGEFYIQINTAYGFTVATATGTGISFSWDFGDSSSGTGVMNSHTYTALGNYNLEVTGSSLVTTAQVIFVIIHVETVVTDVTVTNFYADWLDNIRVGTTKDLDISKTGQFRTTVTPTGMDIEYYWIYETGLQAEITMSNSGNHDYATIGQKSCTVTARNSIGNKTSLAFEFYVIEKFDSSSLQVNENGKVLSNTEENNPFKVALNEQYTFSMKSLQVVPNTEHYFFALRIKSGALQLATINKTNPSITYKFTLETNLTLDAIVENSINKSPTKRIYIECIKALSGPFITAPVGADGNITLGSSITLSGGVTEGKYPEYNWFYAVAPAGETLSGTTDSVIITPGSVGEYIVALDVFNSVSSTQSINYTINVMIGVSGVGIDVTMKYTDAVEQGTDLTFTATVTEGTGLSYNWKSLLLGALVDMATTQTFTYTFSMQALYTITLYIENYASSGTAFIEVYSLVEVPGFTIQISGATYITTINKYAAKTNDVVHFSSSISNTDFLQFDWKIDGTVESSTETLQKTFTSPAEYTVELDASNKISSEDKDIDVIIQTPLTDFSITGCTGTYLLDTVITLTASQTAGTDVSIEWSSEDIGDANGLVTTVTYSAVGVYSVNATGSNYVSNETKLCYITIQGTIDNLQLYVSQHQYVGFPVTFTVTGNSHINQARFSWEFSHGVTKTTTDVATIDETFPTKGTYTLTVTVSNDVSSSSVSLNVTLEDLACNLPVVTMDGSTEHKALRARAIEFSVGVSTGGCIDYASVNKWTVFSTPSCADALSNEYVLESKILTNTPNLLMPSHTLLYGTYCVVFQHSYINTPVQNNIHVNLTVVASDLIAMIWGGDEPAAHEGSMLTLDATESYDPDDTPGTTLNFAWSCTQTMGTSVAAAVCASINAVTSSYANLTGLTLTSGDSYDVGVIVSASYRNSGTKLFTLSIQSSTTPVISMFCVSCNANRHLAMTINKRIAFEGTCIPACTQLSLYQWTVIEKSTGTAITVDSTQTTTGTNQINFVLKHSVLAADKAYTFKFEATEGTQTGHSLLTLLPSSIPSVGTCTIDKYSGIVPLQDFVTIKCQNVVDSDPLSGIYFKIEVRSTTTYMTPYILYSGTKSENTLCVAPLAGNSTVYENVDIKVTAMNDYEAETEIFQIIISFAAPALLTSQSDYTDFTVDQMNGMRMIAKMNNPPALLQYCTAALSYLNILSENNDGNSAKHMAIRDLIANVLNGLPLVTIYDIQTMTSSIIYLVKHSEEISVDTLGIASFEVEVMIEEMESLVVKGDDLRYYDIDTLINIVALVLDSLQNPSSVTSDADVLAKFGDFDDYILSVSMAGNTDTYSSEELRQQAMITKSMEYYAKLMAIPLRAQVANENAIETFTPHSVFHAKHTSVDKITTAYSALGTNLMISDNVLSQTAYSKESVFQFISVSTVNPYNFGSSVEMPLNTKTLSISFHGTNGDYLAITSLSEEDEIAMYMFASNVTQYDINNTGLIYSTGYDPFLNMNYTTKTLEKGKKYEVALSMPNKTGVSVHFQMRVNFTSLDSILKATLYKNDIEYTSATNPYAHPITLTKAMMDVEYIDHRNFTFYIPPSDIGSTDAFKVMMQLTETTNFSGGQYFSICQYFDIGNSSWENEGCTAQADSTASLLSCRCNHMTSFGGSLLVSPDQLDFTDLTKIDVASNPVAIITCSIIVGLYIILVVVFRRLDILDVKRISLIPLCGKDGSFKYEVTIVTGRIPGAGTTAHIGVRLSGEYGKSARQHISKAGAFQRNCSDTFIIAYDVNLGDLRKIQIWHDNRGSSPSWYLSHVIVNDMQTYQKYYFFGNTWLSLEVENGTVHKELRVAGAHEMSHFGYRLKTAMFNSLADKHLWLSLFNRPAQSRFTRVQRVTCCVTILFTFVVVNAMWYGLLKKENTDIGFEGFGWEEVVLALVSNVMVLPLSIGLVFLFKKSRSKANIFDNMQKPQTAQTLEIENLCENSQGGSFESNNTGSVPYDLERESTIDSVPHTALGLHRSRHVAKTHRENTDESIVQKHPTVAVTNTSARSPLWNEDGIMQWPDSVPKYDDGTESRPSTGSTSTTTPAVKQPPAKAGGSIPGATRKSKTLRKGDAGQLLEELDKLENDLKESETRSVKSSRKSSISLRKPTMHKSQWGSLEDILQSDDESIPESSGKMKKRGSTTSQSTAKKFTPRADPRISRNVGMWPKRESLSGESTLSSEGAGKGITAGLRPGYYSEMTMESRDIKVPLHKEKCTLPSWCIYIAYILCVLLSVFSGIIVILYCFKFGYEESLEWVLALILSLVLSVLIIEPLKALLLAVYVVAMFKNVQQEEEDDYIDIEPTFDNSHEKIKDVKFKPISGFALLQAKEEGRKIHRMNVIIRQFIAYVFYLWLIMVIVFVNFRYDSYLMTKHVQNDFIAPTTPDYLNFTNITSIDEFWDWSENVFVDSLYKENLTTDEEHGFLLGTARMRLIRGLTAKCIAANAAIGLGASSLTDRTCHGEGNYDEDTGDYAEGWNESVSNYSWRHYTSSQLGSTHRIGHIAMYGGGGYTQVLGTSQAETDSILSYLKDNGWIDLQTRAIIVEFALYSPGTDVTSLVALLAEFPLTGGVITSYEIQSQKLLWYQKRTVDPLMVLECILLLVIVYTLVHTVLQIRDHGKQYFKDIWNWYEILTTLMALVSIGMYIGCVVEATNTFNNYLDNRNGFTNFERAVYVHVGMRYLHAWLLFLLMYKVVRQMRFIKFMYVYERTLSTAVGHLLGTGLIYVILLLVYAQVGYLMYGQFVSGFQTVGHSINTLIVMIRGNFDFWLMLDHQPIFSHFYVYSYYVFAYGIMIALVISILTSTYKVLKSQMYYTATLEMQDYEMIDFMMKRFKLWSGIQKAKPAFRRVRFPGLPSVSSRSSSSYSNRSSASLHSAESVAGPQFSEVQLRSMMARMVPTWQAVLKRMDKIVALDDEEANLVRRAENEMKDLNWKCRINELERQHKELLGLNKQPSTSCKSPLGDAKHRQSILKRLAMKDNQDRKAPATVTGAPTRTAASSPDDDDDTVAQGWRPLSDQGARVEQSSMSKRRSSSTEKSKIQTLFKSIKPSKPAWNK